MDSRICLKLAQQLSTWHQLRKNANKIRSWRFHRPYVHPIPNPLSLKWAADLLHRCSGIPCLADAPASVAPADVLSTASPESCCCSRWASDAWAWAAALSPSFMQVWHRNFSTLGKLILLPKGWLLNYRMAKCCVGRWMVLTQTIWLYMKPSMLWVCYGGHHQQYGGALGYNCGSTRKIW